MRQEIGIEAGQTVVDLAAGTGKLTRLLVELLPAEVIAVEPVAGMRAQLERVLPGVTVLDGTAEQIPLADGAAHAVFVAQAFHWFRVPEAAAEIARVLDADGALAIVRNQEVESATAPAVTAALALVRERVHHPSTASPRSGATSWSGRGVRAVSRVDGRQPGHPGHRDVPSPDRVAQLHRRDGRRPARAAARRGAGGARAQRHRVPGEPFTVPTVTRVIWARTRRAR